MPVTIKIGRDEALVLFSLLAEFCDQDCLEVPGPAERLALVRLQGALEKSLVEPFRPDYLELLKHARNHLTHQFGKG